MKNKKIILLTLISIVTVIALIFMIFTLKNKTYAVSNNKIETTEKTVEVTRENKNEESDQDKIITIILNEDKEYIEANSKTTENKSKKAVSYLKNKNKNKKQEELEENEPTNTTQEEQVIYAYENQEQNNSIQNIDYNEYYIMVNYTANVVNIYGIDSSGNKLDCVKAFICSTGTATPTSGVYKTDYKYRWISLFGNVYGQYATRIVGNILFHSVPYTENYNNASLEYWEYDKLGTTASAGCVRLTVEDAKWIYDNCKSGTYVEFYSDENPGPLRKAKYNKNI